MTSVAFLRGANLGAKRFSPKALVDALSDLEITNLGAAGTFVVRGKASPGVLRKRFAEQLPFEPELLVVPAHDVVQAVQAGERVAVPTGAKRFATLLGSTPANVALPLEAPAKGSWGVRVVRLEGRFALGVRRSVASHGVYPNEVVERAFAVRATTRDWTTMERLADLVRTAGIGTRSL